MSKVYTAISLKAFRIKSDWFWGIFKPKAVLIESVLYKDAKYWQKKLKTKMKNRKDIQIDIQIATDNAYLRSGGKSSLSFLHIKIEKEGREQRSILNHKAFPKWIDRLTH